MYVGDIRQETGSYEILEPEFGRFIYVETKEDWDALSMMSFVLRNWVDVTNYLEKCSETKKL